MSVHTDIRRLGRMNIPLSTPEIDVNKSAADCFAFSASVSAKTAPSLVLSPSFAVPGITIFVGALDVVKTVGMAELPIVETDVMRASRIIGSFSRCCSVSGWMDSTKYLLCLRTSLTLP